MKEHLTIINIYERGEKILYVDIHCHILPGVDDGAQTIQDSIEMAKQAVSEGVSHVICTPHHNNGTYINKKNEIIRRVATLQAIMDEKKIPITLYEGQEIRISGDILNKIAQNEILFTDLEDTYLLIEFPSIEVPNYAHKVLFDLCSQGYHPIIVHPERNTHFIKNPNLMIPFIEMGCLAQITCGSYIGEFGKEVRNVTQIMIEHNMVHLLASDAHNIEGRNFHVKSAYEKLAKEFGEKTSEEFQKNAKKVINGDNIRTIRPQEYKKRFRFFR